MSGVSVPTDVQELLVRDDDQRVDRFLERLQPFDRLACCGVRPSNSNGRVTTPTVSAPRSRAMRATSGARAGAGAAAHAGGHEHHVRVLERVDDEAFVLLERALADLGVPARAQALGELGTDLDAMRPPCDNLSACASVLMARNSTPASPSWIMRLMALPPAPPTPATVMRARLSDSRSNSNLGHDVPPRFHPTRGVRLRATHGRVRCSLAATGGRRSSRARASPTMRRKPFPSARPRRGGLAHCKSPERAAYSTKPSAVQHAGIARPLRANRVRSPAPRRRAGDFEHLFGQFDGAAQARPAAGQHDAIARAPAPPAARSASRTMPSSLLHARLDDAGQRLLVDRTALARRAAPRLDAPASTASTKASPARRLSASAWSSSSCSAKRDVARHVTAAGLHPGQRLHDAVAVHRGAGRLGTDVDEHRAATAVLGVERGARRRERLGGGADQFVAQVLERAAAADRAPGCAPSRRPPRR